MIFEKKDGKKKNNLPRSAVYSRSIRAFAHPTNSPAPVLKDFPICPSNKLRRNCWTGPLFSFSFVWQILLFFSCSFLPCFFPTKQHTTSNLSALKLRSKIETIRLLGYANEVCGVVTSQTMAEAVTKTARKLDPPENFGTKNNHRIKI